MANYEPTQTDQAEWMERFRERLPILEIVRLSQEYGPLREWAERFAETQERRQDNG